MSYNRNQDLEDLSVKGKCISVGQLRRRIQDCDKLDDFLEWNYDIGEYDASLCQDCNFPKLAHHDDFCWGQNKKRNPGTPPKTGWQEDTIVKMMDIISNDDVINHEVDKKDTRPHKTACTCGRQFKTRIEPKEHEMLKHNRNYKSSFKSSQFQVTTNQHQVVVQVNDPPKVPKWDEEDFETFELRIGEWIKRTKDDKAAQYHSF